MGNGYPPSSTSYSCAEDRQERLDGIDLREQVERLEQVQTQQPEAVLVKTATKVTYPTAASSYYWCEIQKINSDTPAEGSAPTAVGTGRFIWAYNTGTTIPPSGTLRIAAPRGGRYVFNHCC